MKQEFFIIKRNRQIAKDTFELVLFGNTSKIKRAGQFVNMKIKGVFLRRPISVCDYTDDLLTLVYKVVGEGTEILSRMEEGEVLDLLVGLGNGYDLEESGQKPLLIGGGVGIPPLYNLCKKLISNNKAPTVILGFNTKDEVFYKEKFEELGAKVYVTTVDGSVGEKGFVTDIIPNIDYTYFYTCGPLAMFTAIEKVVKTSGQYSFEEHMGCGFGACVGCYCKTKYGYKKICIDGPVLKREEIIW